MADDSPMSKETFLRIAEVSGLDVKDTKHMDELYNFVLGVLPAVKSLDELDLSSVEPAMIYVPPKE